MKLRLIVICILCFAVCFSGCVSQKEYDLLKNEVSKLQTDISDKEQEISRLKDRIEDLNNTNKGYLEKIDELENGASKLLSNVNNAYEAKNYSEAVKFADTLHSRFNGSQEDIKAQEIAKICQAELDKIEAEKKAEEERKATEAAKSEEQKVHDIIRVYKLEVDEINSADGVSVEIAWLNNSPKTIKYIRFKVTPYNAVNDIVTCEIKRTSTMSLKMTGPYKTGEGGAEFIAGNLYGAYWENVWYNNTVDRLEFEEINIEYMDGTTEIISGEELKYVIY